jgi:zeaxanthin glucosyltransferase
MARIGVFCFPGTGHINPITALARRLQQRGHTVVVFGIADIEAQVKAAGVEFCLIGESDYPPGMLKKLDQRLSEKRGLATFRFTVERVRNTALMILRDGPQAVRSAKVDALLVDEADMGGSVAEHLGLPYVSIAYFPPLVQTIGFRLFVLDGARARVGSAGCATAWDFGCFPAWPRQFFGWLTTSAGRGV